jgi:hypothetical protein
VTLYRGRSAVALDTSDVSFKGLFLCTKDPPPLRSLVRLDVTLAGRQVQAHAMAVHIVQPKEGDGPHGEAGVGLQFWGLAGPDRTAWDDFVRDLIHKGRSTAKPAREPAPYDPEATSGVRVAPVRAGAVSKAT